MTNTLTHKFLLALEPCRDPLYASALTQSQSPSAAEQLLLATTKTLFTTYTQEGVRDIPAAFQKALGTPPIPTTPAPADAPAVAMPADLWARLAAAVQQEAARSANTTALHPDSALLRPDPVLAPRKKSTAKPAADDVDLTSPTRLLAVGGLITLAAAVFTIYLLSRPSQPVPASNPATTNTSQPTP